MQYDLETTQKKFEDFLNEDGNGDRKNDLCFYYDGSGQPGCVVTHFLLWLGIPNVEEILFDKAPDNGVFTKYRNSSTVSGLDREFYAWGFSIPAVHWLSDVQEAADGAVDFVSGREGRDITWKQAFATANEEFDPNDEDNNFASWPQTPCP